MWGVGPKETMAAELREDPIQRGGWAMGLFLKVNRRDFFVPKEHRVRFCFIGGCHPRVPRTGQPCDDEGTTMAKPTVILIGADKGAWARRRWPLRCYTNATAVGVTTTSAGIISFDPFFLSTLDTLPLSVLYRIAHLGQIQLKVDRQYLVSYKNRLENLDAHEETPVEARVVRLQGAVALVVIE